MDVPPLSTTPSSLTECKLRVYEPLVLLVTGIALLVIGNTLGISMTSGYAGSIVLFVVGNIMGVALMLGSFYQYKEKPPAPETVEPYQPKAKKLMIDGREIKSSDMVWDGPFKDKKNRKCYRINFQNHDHYLYELEAFGNKNKPDTVTICGVGDLDRGARGGVIHNADDRKAIYYYYHSIKIR